MPATALAPPTVEPILTRAVRVLAGDVRAEDCLPTTPAVRAGVAADLAAVPTSPPALSETVRRQTRQRLLAHHHGGQNVAYVEADAGVVVLAVGLDQVGELLRGVPPADRAALRLTVPDPLD